MDSVAIKAEAMVKCLAKPLREYGKCLVYIDDEGRIQAAISISRQAEHVMKHRIESVIGTFDRNTKESTLREEVDFFLRTQC